MFPPPGAAQDRAHASSAKSRIAAIGPGQSAGPHGALRRWADRLVTQPAELALLMLAVALAARAAQFGNPVVQVDDQFYLLVGERLLHGELPYVDHWDRKPLGLFLIYAAAAWLGEGVLAHQLLATLSAAATGLAIARIARRIAAPHGAAAAGVVYILSLGLLGGDGGQSPVFYNLLTASAAWLAVRCIEAPHFGLRAFRLGLGATALLGLALQIKYAVVFEACFIGLALLDHGRRAGAAPARLALAALPWIAAGIAPTLLAWSLYAQAGHGAAFADANFIEILHRRADPARLQLARLAWIAGLLLPLATAALLSIRVPAPIEDGHATAVRRLVHGWLLASIGGVLLFGTWFDHYALPVLVPLAVAAAPLLGLPGARLAIVVPPRSFAIPPALALMLFATIGSAAIINENRRVRGWGPQVQDLAAEIRDHPAGCLYIFDGDAALYRLSRACIPTRWSFPDHLSHLNEQGSIGTDALAELHRILATRPGHIVIRSNRTAMIPGTWELVQATLERDYRLAMRRGSGGADQLLYTRVAGR